MASILHGEARRIAQAVRRHFSNEDFGDVYGNIYAFTADGLTSRRYRRPV